MATIARDPSANYDAATVMYLPNISGCVLGADVDTSDPCYIAADGLVYPTTSVIGKIDGFANRKGKAGEPITLLAKGARFRNATVAQTPGTDLYLGAVAGELNTTAAGTAVARMINATDIRVTRDA